MSVWGEPGSRRRAGWDLAGSLFVVAVFVLVAMPDAAGGYRARDWLLLPLLVWAAAVNLRHIRRAVGRLRDPAP